MSLYRVQINHNVTTCYEKTYEIEADSDYEAEELATKMFFANGTDNLPYEDMWYEDETETLSEEIEE